MDRQLLENIFVTALEGGSNHWYFINNANHHKIRKAVPKSDDPYFATAMLSAILDHGVEVEVHDSENEDEVLGVLKTSDMEERMKELDKNPNFMWALEAEENGEGDAETSDIIFQYLVMGDVCFG